MADPVESVSGGVRLDVFADCFENHADDDEEDHQQEAFAATANVDDLGDGEFADACYDGAEDGGHGEEAVLVERGCDVGYEAAVDGLEEGVDEGDEVESVKVGCKQSFCGNVL